MSSKKRKPVLILTHAITFYILIMIFGSCAKDRDDFSPILFDSVNIGLYIDQPVWPNLRVCTPNIIEELDLPCTVLNNDSILYGDLTRYSVLILPGGRPDLYYQNLGGEGFSAIVKYVRRGGGYIGICGTGYLAAETSIWRGWAGEPRIYNVSDGMGIFKGTVDGPADDFAPSYRDESCRIRILDKEHPVTSNLPDTMIYVYDHGPMFITEADGNTSIIAETVNGNKVFIITAEYYNGRVFLSSGHPEVTNDANCRQLFRNAIIWCSKQDN